MVWENILKRIQKGSQRRGISPKDIRSLNYILRDGEFKTAERIMDEIYDFIAENKKLGAGGVGRMVGRPESRRIGVGIREMKRYMTNSPDYEVRDTGKKYHSNKPIKEYRYIGE